MSGTYGAMSRLAASTLLDPWGGGHAPTDARTRNRAELRSVKIPPGTQSSTPLRLDDLMQASEERLSAAVRSVLPHEQLIATRIIDSPRDFTRWESYHAGLMRRIVLAGEVDAQRTQLLSAALGLIHRKATFEYLRNRALKGRDRVRFFEHFYSQGDYHSSVIAEHGHYLRSAA